jgi:asparagine synthase (glutamine-hydrolysing)
MCGIAGIVSLGGERPTVGELQAMCDVLHHRGPDSGGAYLSHEAGLAMRRLSIIDLDTGSQPVHNEDRSIWTVLNGEIYNYRDLRYELQARGHVFHTRSDTEVLVHLYEDLGPACVERLRGMFAFAIWDARQSRLLLARDRLGIKPLFYAHLAGRLIFASELKAILEVPGVPRALDWMAVDHVFSALVTPPSASILADVKKLEPGHLMEASPREGVRVRAYWQLRFASDPRVTPAALEERLRGLLEESVRLHLVSDVPVGAFLSGGLDSSAVVATMARLDPGPVRTFTIGFRESSFDEAAAAGAFAREIGTRHEERTLHPDSIDALDRIVWHLDEPFGDVSAIPTYMVSKLAAEQVKVVLSGDGGDELFAGYDKYRVERKERFLGLIPAVLRNALRALATALPEKTRGRNLLRHWGLDDSRRYIDASVLFPRSEKERLFRPDPLRSAQTDDLFRDELDALRASSSHWLTPLQAWDLKRYLPLDVLTKVDRMSMAHSLEVRVPLLDHELVEFAATIPPELNLRGATSKLLFRRAVRDLVPAAVLDRPKHGFAVPIGAWLRRELSGAARELLLSGTTRQRGIFEPRRLESLIDAHAAGRPLDLQLWTLLCFESWCRMFLDRPRPRPREAASPTMALALSLPAEG